MSAPVNLPIRLVLIDPPAGVDFGIQAGRGTKFSILFPQSRATGDIAFDFEIGVNGKRADGRPNLTGPIVQGPPTARFIYIGVGTYAGQETTPWSRRIKVPLAGITWNLLRQTEARLGRRLVARIPGTGRDGTPSCATVRPIGKWEVIESP